MNTNVEELAHSFNVVLDKRISAKIKDVQETVASKIKERRNYDNSPHLAVATKFMRAVITDNFVKALYKEFSAEKPFEITFTRFESAETGNYIFLNLDTESREKLFALSERAFQVTRGVGFEGHGGLAPKYPYDPHISVIKLETEEINHALGLINKDLSNLKMRASAFEITRGQLNDKGFGEFPVVATINLQE